MDGAKLTDVIARLLPDLFRHHVCLTWSAPAASLRAEWVDAILLPLIRKAP